MTDPLSRIRALAASQVLELADKLGTPSAFVEDACGAVALCGLCYVVWVVCFVIL